MCCRHQQQHRHPCCCNDKLLQEQQVDKELYDDWSTFNKLLSSIELSLPDMNFTQSGVDISISQIVCCNLTMGGMTLDTTFLNATMQRLSCAPSNGTTLPCSAYLAVGREMPKLTDRRAICLPMLISSRWILCHIFLRHDSFEMCISIGIEHSGFDI